MSPARHPGDRAVLIWRNKVAPQQTAKLFIIGTTLQNVALTTFNSFRFTDFGMQISSKNFPRHKLYKKGNKYSGKTVDEQNEIHNYIHLHNHILCDRGTPEI